MMLLNLFLINHIIIAPMQQKTTLVITTLNEAKTINLLLTALLKQTHQPDQVILVDGGSSDQTVSLIKEFLKKNHSHPLAKNFLLKVIKNSNRAKARNWAIKQAKYPLIAITDAGCIPQPSWLEKLLKTSQKTNAPIIGGFFYGLPANGFEQAVVAYTLQMPDKVDPKTFMPTTRSVLITKNSWQKLHGFNTNLSKNEDFDFFYRARLQKISIAFAKDALVGWIPRHNWKDFTKMIYNFAQGDLEAGIIRPKVKLLFGRYFLVLLAIAWLVFFRGMNFISLLPALLFWLGIYLLWAIYKNVRYAPQGWYYLPLIQLVADFAVMTGSIVGLVNRYRSQSSTSSTLLG